MSGGRPSSWTEEIQQDAWDYANGGWEKAGDMIPSAVGLCIAINLPKSTLYDWSKQDDKQFSDILGLINAKQQNVLINKGLSGDFNSNIAKLVLGKHGFHDKTDSTHSGADGGPMEFTEIRNTIVDP